MKRMETALLCGLITAVLLSSLTGFARRCEDVREQVVRLHILANSDGEADQELKLQVRDAVLEATGELFSLSADREEAEAGVLEQLDLMEEIARQEILRQGYDYSVEAELVSMYFETRSYDQVTLPAGYYDAVRITIGAGEGRNWWCVMFPPMCIPAATADTGTPLEEEITRLGTEPMYEPKFAVVELVESVRNRLEKRTEQPVTVAEAGA